MGVGGEERWEPVIVTLTAPWSLVFYTDGLVEGRAAPESDDRFGEHGLVARLRDLRPIDERGGGRVARLMSRRPMVAA